jgi:hypothetical protein
MALISALCGSSCFGFSLAAPALAFAFPETLDTRARIQDLGSTLGRTHGPHIHDSCKDLFLPAHEFVSALCLLRPDKCPHTPKHSHPQHSQVRLLDLNDALNLQQSGWCSCAGTARNISRIASQASCWCKQGKQGAKLPASRSWCFVSLPEADLLGGFLHLSTRSRRQRRRRLRRISLRLPSSGRGCRARSGQGRQWWRLQLAGCSLVRRILCRGILPLSLELQPRQGFRRPLIRWCVCLYGLVLQAPRG